MQPAAAQPSPITAFRGVENYPQILCITLWILAAANFPYFEKMQKQGG